jgi:uncharacterized glyoxalase superfamily protein PhnB
MNINKITPVLIVDRIEPVIPFWKKLGAAVTVEVPDGTAGDGRLGFVILVLDGIEIMYQTLSSVRDDLVKASSAKDAFRTDLQQTTLFVEVLRLDDVETALAGERLVMPRRTTFYGSTESGYADPAGHIIVFAQHAP